MIERLKDDELELALKEALGDERTASRRFLTLFVEFARRGLHGKSVHATLFAYCTRELRLSEGDAYRRIRAMESARAYPKILDMLEAGELHLSAVAVLSAHLTDENHERLLSEAARVSKHDLERIIATLPTFRGPAPRRDTIVLLPAASRPPAPARQAAKPELIQAPPATAPVSTEARVAFTADEELLAELARAKELLGHRFPSGELGPVFKAALKALLDRIDPERWPEARRRAVLNGTRRPPKWVRQEVFRRDGGRCAFKDKDGRRCQALSWLEYDHIIPFAAGGPSDDPKNIRLLCRAHNQRAAKDVFGEEKVALSIERRRRAAAMPDAVAGAP